MDMQPASVPARLANAGVPVVAGDAHSITYRVDGHAVTADLVIVAERMRSPLPVLDRVRLRPGRRVLVVCDAIMDEAP